MVENILRPKQNCSADILLWREWPIKWFSSSNSNNTYITRHQNMKQNERKEKQFTTSMICCSVSPNRTVNASDSLDTGRSSVL